MLQRNQSSNKLQLPAGTLNLKFTRLDSDAICLLLFLIFLVQNHAVFDQNENIIFFISVTSYHNIQIEAF